MYELRDVGHGGMSQDLPDRDTEAKYVKIARNVTAEGGMMRVSCGFEKVADTDEPIIHMQELNDAREPRNLLLIGQTKAYGWNGTHILDVTQDPLIAPLKKDKWSSAEIGGMLIFTHHHETPRIWNPITHDQEQYLHWDATRTWHDKNFTAGLVATYKNYIVMGGGQEAGREYPRMIRWSASVTDSYTIPHWNPLPSNDAGSVELDDLATGVLDMLQLEDGLIIYGSHTAYLMQWVGGTFVHRFQRLDDIAGILDTGMAINVNDMHFVVGQTDIYVHNGRSPKSIVDEKLRYTIFDQLNDKTVKHSFLVKNWQMEEIWLCMPEEGEEYATKAYAWNWITNTWTEREIPPSLDAESAISPACKHVVTGATHPCPVWGNLTHPTWEDWPATWAESGGERRDIPEVIFATTDNKLVQRMDGEGKYYEPLIERTGLQIGDYEKQYTLQTVYPMIEVTHAFVQIGVQLAETHKVQWGKARRFDPDLDKKLDIRGDNLTGSLFSYRVFAKDDDPSVFQFSGLELEFAPSGRD